MSRWYPKLFSCLLVLAGFSGRAIGQDDPFFQGDPAADIAADAGFSAASPTAEEQIQAQVEQLYNQGKTLLDSGQSDEAWAKFNEAAMTSRMTHYPSLLAKGQLEREQGFLQQALQSLQIAATYSQGDRTAFLELGQAYLDLERTEDAISAFQNVLASRPRDAEALYNLGLAQAEFAYGQQFADAESRRLDLETAVSTLDQALLVKPDYAEALFQRGRARMSLGLMDEALEDLQQSANLDSSNAETAAELGFGNLRRAASEANTRKGQRAKIVQDYQTAITYFSRYFEIVGPDPEEDKEDPDTIRPENVYINRSAARIGLAEEVQGDRSVYLRDAIADAEAAIELNPAISDAHFQKGVAHRLLNELEPAIDSLSEALEINPGNSEALLRRGIIYFRQGNLEMAQPDFEDSLRFALRSPRASFWLGLTFAKKDMPARAIEHYNAALRLQPRFPLAYLNRGLAQMKIGRFHRAAIDFSEVLQRDRRNSLARSLRDQALQLMKQRG